MIFQSKVFRNNDSPPEIVWSRASKSLASFSFLTLPMTLYPLLAKNIAMSLTIFHIIFYRGWYRCQLRTFRCLTRLPWSGRPNVSGRPSAWLYSPAVVSARNTGWNRCDRKWWKSTPWWSWRWNEPCLKSLLSLVFVRVVKKCCVSVGGRFRSKLSQKIHHIFMRNLGFLPLFHCNFSNDSEPLFLTPPTNIPKNSKSEKSDGNLQYYYVSTSTSKFQSYQLSNAASQLFALNHHFINKYLLILIIVQSQKCLSQQFFGEFFVFLPDFWEASPVLSSDIVIRTKIYNKTEELTIDSIFYIFILHIKELRNYFWK